MRILYLALLILIFNTPVAFGAGCTDATNQTSCNALAGCEFINNTCTPCQNGYYKGQNSDLCDECPNGYDYTSVHNIGAKKEEDCFKQCERSEQEGTIKNPQAPIVYYPKTCIYNISCVENDNNPCSSYYLNSSGTECLPRWEITASCTNGLSDGIQIRTQAANITYCTNKTSCKPDYHFEPDTSAPQCIPPDDQEITLGKCTSDTKSCAELINSCGGIISGEASWDTDINGYDLSACACTITTTSEAYHGTLQTTCFHGKTVNEWTNCTKKMIECYAGYWADTNNQAPDGCDAVGNGYYSVADDTDRQKCPAGSTTSTTTAASINNCHMTAGKTKICDTENNCITLPGNNSKFFYTGKTQ